MKSNKNSQGLNLEEFLADYDPKKYDQPSVAVDIAPILPDNKVLLIKRKDHPNINSWALPGGFVEMDENLMISAQRELEEETNLKKVKLVQFGVYGEPTRDPRCRIISVAFYHVFENSNIKYSAGDDASDAKVFNWRIVDTGIINLPAQKTQVNNITLPCTALGHTLPSQAQAYDFMLTSGDINLSATIAILKNGTTCLVSNPALMHPHDEHLASDHALILFDALVRASFFKII